MNPSEELKAKANSPEPQVSEEGQAAAGRIAAARAKADNTITSESLAPQAEVQVTDPQTGTAMAGLGGALEAQTDSFAQGLTDTRNQREAEKNQSRNDYSSLVANRTGLEGFSLQADQEAGVFEAESALQDINNKLRTEQLARRRSNELITSTGGQSKGQAQSQINNVNRESYSKQADMAIVQLAAQGRFNSASALADRKANAMFEQEQNQIDAAKITYEDNKDLYNKAEKREFETALTDRTNRVQAEKEQMQAVQKRAIDALNGGAPQSLVSEMMKSKTLADASALGGQFVGALDREQQRASIESSLASAAKDETSRLLDLAEAGDANAISTLGLTMSDNSQPTRDDIAYARQYAATGKVPSGLSSADVSFGDIAELASDLPKQDGAIVDINTNVASGNLSSADNASFDALYNAINTDLPLMMEAFTQMNTVSTFGELDENNVPVETSFGTGVVGGIQNTINPSEASTRFDTIKADFTAKLVLARSGAAATEEEVNRYLALVPSRFNTPLGIGKEGDVQLSALENQMTSALDDKLNTRGLSIYGYSTVEAGGESYTAGEIITSEYGQQGRVNPDGSITLINN